MSFTPFSFEVDTQKKVFENDRFWAAAGLDSLYPLVMAESGRYLMERMQKSGSCLWLRNHFTLSEHACDGFSDAGGNVYSEDENGNPVYHFDKINGILKQYLKYGMKPILEMDFLPDELSYGVVTGGDEARYHKNRYIPTDWDKWHDLLVAFTRNLADTFGLEEIRTWYFEVWNEADDWAYEDWKLFYHLYDVFVEAVTSVDDRLRVGGPGSFKLDFLRGFLQHVSGGTNTVTGETGTRIDFISHHIYGMSGSWVHEFPLVSPSVQYFANQIMNIQRMINGCHLEHVEFMMDEWGVFSHYEKNASRYPAVNYRNTAYSALFFIKLADVITKIREKFGFHVTRMLYWGFSSEDDPGSDSHHTFNGNRGLSTAPHLMKPIGTAHEMMARLGEDILAVSGTSSGLSVGCLAARSEQSVQCLVYHYDECDPDGCNPARNGLLRLTGLEDGRYSVQVITLDEEHHNTYAAWVRAGRPEDLTDPAFETIRACQELTPDQTDTLTAVNGQLSVPVTLPSLSARLFLIQKA